MATVQHAVKCTQCNVSVQLDKVQCNSQSAMDTAPFISAMSTNWAVQFNGVSAKCKQRVYSVASATVQCSVQFAIYRFCAVHNIVTLWSCCGSVLFGEVVKQSKLRLVWPNSSAVVIKEWLRRILPRKGGFREFCFQICGISWIVCEVVPLEELYLRIVF